VTWIPQQLWEPMEKPHGLWTICVHPNTAEDSLVDRLRAFLRDHAAQFTSVERVLSEWRPARLGAVERLYATLALWRVHGRQARKRLNGKMRRTGAV
jgi:hypothetical protein